MIFTDSEGREWEVVDSYKGSSYKIIRPVKQEPPHKETASTSSISGIEADTELELALMTYRATGNTDGVLAWRDKAVVAAKVEARLIAFHNAKTAYTMCRSGGDFEGWLDDRIDELVDGAKDDNN